MLKQILAIIGIGILFGSCSMKWNKAMQMGSTLQKEFNAEVTFDPYLRLIIVPVEIEGATYRFLFDTGAPFSISQELQNKLEYKTIAKGNIVDTDKNRTKVNYVSVDSLLIADVPFYKQTAFVADFKANPIIACMELDGIIGSNLMRHCNWLIKEDEQVLQLSNDGLPESMKDVMPIPFKVDVQYNMKMDINIGNVKASNCTVDYGSNGSMAVNKTAFKQFEENGIVKESFTEKGASSSGLLGEVRAFENKIGHVDTVQIEEATISNVLVKSGYSNILGREVLSRYNVFIDWQNHELRLMRNNKESSAYEVFGMQVGPGNNNAVAVQAVIENSVAAQAGIHPMMEILKVNELDFTQGSNFCDYIHLMDSKPSDLFLEIKDEEGVVSQVKLRKKRLGEK